MPTGNGTPLITDGFFTPGEWDDALRLPVADDLTILLKEYRGVVFIGLRGFENMADLFLAAPGGPIEKLHVSFGLAQAVVPRTGPEPPLRLGPLTDWYANKIRGDEEQRALTFRLQREGVDIGDIPMGTNYPSQGIEFVIRRSKIPGRVWLMRISAAAIVAGRPDFMIYPPATAERTTDGWLELRLQ